MSNFSEVRFGSWLVDEDERFTGEMNDIGLLEARQRIDAIIAQLERKRRQVVRTLINRANCKKGMSLQFSDC